MCTVYYLCFNDTKTFHCHPTEAITKDYLDIALYLIDAKCDVNLQDRLKQAPIHTAVSKGEGCHGQVFRNQCFLLNNIAFTQKFCNYFRKFSDFGAFLGDFKHCYVL